MSYPQELRSRIMVVAIAPAAYINRKLCHSVVHYTTALDRDIVPYLDVFGRIVNSSTLVILPPDENASLFDHDFRSHTYNEVLGRAINNYIFEFCE